MPVMAPGVLRHGWLAEDAARCRDNTLGRAMPVCAGPAAKTASGENPAGPRGRWRKLCRLLRRGPLMVRRPSRQHSGLREAVNTRGERKTAMRDTWT